MTKDKDESLPLPYLTPAAIIATQMHEADKYRNQAYTRPDCPNNCQAWHSVNQVAAMLSVGRWKVYQLMKEGRLRFIDREIGRRVRHCWIEEFRVERHK
jgi:excisionase family DNA binding protein